MKLLCKLGIHHWLLSKSNLLGDMCLRCWKAKEDRSKLRNKIDYGKE